jgi:hypothetical protein
MSALISFIVSFFVSSYVTHEVIMYRMYGGDVSKSPPRDDDIICRLKREARIRGEHIC